MQIKADTSLSACVCLNNVAQAILSDLALGGAPYDTHSYNLALRGTFCVFL